jgi:transposase
MPMLIPDHVKIYACLEHTDMRKSINTLSLLVSDFLKMDPCSGHLFLFRSQRGDKIKILFYEKHCFTLWYRRLERGRFIFPKNKLGCIEMTIEHFNWILSSNHYATLDDSHLRKYNYFY